MEMEKKIDIGGMIKIALYGEKKMQRFHLI
jgi:hypothetical protein